jgi:hypothetical protein
MKRVALVSAIVAPLLSPMSAVGSPHMLTLRQAWLETKRMARDAFITDALTSYRVGRNPQTDCHRDSFAVVDCRYEITDAVRGEASMNCQGLVRVRLTHSRIEGNPLGDAICEKRR